MSKPQPTNENFDPLGHTKKQPSVPKTVMGRREAAYQRWRKELRQALRKARG